MNNWERLGLKNKEEGIARAFQFLKDNSKSICGRGIPVDGYCEVAFSWQNKLFTLREKHKKKKE